MEKKRTYYKLGQHASVFSDPTTGLKITKNVPGSITKPESKTTASAKANGHIIEITKEEFEVMMSKISPEEKKAAYEEQNIEEASTDEGDSSNSGSGEEDAERPELLEKLKKIKMTPSKRKEVTAYPTPKLKEFIEKEED